MVVLLLLLRKGLMFPMLSSNSLLTKDSLIPAPPGSTSQVLTLLAWTTITSSLLFCICMYVCGNLCHKTHMHKKSDLAASTLPRGAYLSGFFCQGPLCSTGRPQTPDHPVGASQKYWDYKHVPSQVLYFSSNCDPWVYLWFEGSYTPIYLLLWLTFSRADTQVSNCVLVYKASSGENSRKVTEFPHSNKEAGKKSDGHQFPF